MEKPLREGKHEAYESEHERKGHQVRRRTQDYVGLGGRGLTSIMITPEVPPGVEASPDLDLIMNDRTVTGILGGDAIPDLFIPKLIELYSQGRDPFDRLITFYPFDEINQAVEDMEEGRVFKPVLRL
jgi:aryl-alcohol dehydrogenase